jgi:hypothetical protein
LLRSKKVVDTTAVEDTEEFEHKKSLRNEAIASKVTNGLLVPRKKDFHPSGLEFSTTKKRTIP